VPRERVLSRRELNRALLARQFLLRRVTLSVPRAIERIGALQAQWPPSPYIGLWSRLEGFRREQLMRAVERRQVVRATVMRTTLHHVSARDYLDYAGELRIRRAASLETQISKFPGGADLDELARQVVLHTSERPRTRPELLRLLGLPKLELDDRRPWLLWHLLSARAGLVHAPASSVWRMNTSGAFFVPVEAWLGAEPATGDDAVCALLRRYLAAFGPATRADAAQWTGLTVGALEPGFARLALRQFRDEDGRMLYDLPRAPLPPATTPAPPRFLPMWDSTLLAHDDRRRILPEAYRKVVILKNGDVRRTFLVDGRVAGLWTVMDGRVELEPFEPIPSSARRQLDEEARGLAEFHRSKH
jgi:winged helix DNA-binding protein